MYSFRLHPALLALIPLLSWGCDSPSGPVYSSIPLGRYLHEKTIVRNGETQRHARTIELSSQSLGYIRDTIWAPAAGGSWSVDSIAETTLQFQVVGDGYQRTAEIRSEGGAAVDTTVSYWYFFRRSDTLYFYNGIRLLGENGGLVGAWRSDPRDTAINGVHYSYTFGHDSVSIVKRYLRTSIEIRDSVPYEVNGDHIEISSAAYDHGDRYEVVPGWSLYLTGRGKEGYVRRR